MELFFKFGYWFVEHGIWGVALGSSMAMNILLVRIVLALLPRVKESAEILKKGDD